MMVESMGEEHAAEHFRSFGTICSATQERQDAVLDMMKEPPDIMLVVGGYNSSNTNHLAHLCREYTTTFHVKDAECIDADSGAINHKPELDPHAPEVTDWNWLPPGPLQLGITAGASTRTTRSAKPWPESWRSGGSKSTTRTPAEWGRRSVRTGLAAVDNTRVAPRAAEAPGWQGAGLLDVQRPAERAQSPLRNRL